MMKRLLTAMAVVAILAVSLNGTAYADTYPISPPGASVALAARDFIQFVPEESPGLPVPNPVIGNNLGQHPGAFVIGFPELGSYFIGVFGGLIDTSNPTAAVYLWETTGGFPNTVPFPGPQIQVGYWDGLTFTAYGISQYASYLGTGIPETGQPPDTSRREITSSITPLVAFGITPGFASPLNAVRIEVADFSHPQVTAVAATTVPEPSAMLLLGTGTALIGCSRLRSRKESLGLGPARAKHRVV